MTRQNLYEAQIFLNYLKNQGFQPNIYKKILELGNCPEQSLSRLLKKYKPYLLSYMSSDERLKKIGIRGGKGYIKEGQIIYPEKPSETATIRSRIYDKRDYPTIDDFGVIISSTLNEKAFAAASIPIDKYFGFCLDQDDKNLSFQINRGHLLLEEIKSSGQKDYELKITERNDGKVFCLIKKQEQRNI